MTSAPITDAMKCTWVLQPDTFPELMEFGIHTGLRDDSDWPALLTKMAAIVSSDFSALQSTCHYTALRLSTWQTGGFTGWHQVASTTLSLAAGSVSLDSPHQLSVVGGYRNTTDLAVPVQRRRNRTYFPLPKKSQIQTDGRLSTSDQTNYSGNLVNWDAALRAGPASTPGAAFDGLVVVSPAAGACYDADTVVIGRRFDVHRSRAEQTPENPTFTPIP